MTSAQENMNTVSERKSKVLVCDDSKIVRMAAKKILLDRFDPIFAEDGEKGWALLCSDPEIQVVFTDLGMPKLNGYELIQKVRTSPEQRLQNLPIIVITGIEEDNEEVKSKLFDLGATDFISKPFDSTSILARAEAHTSYQRVTRVLQEQNDVDSLTGGLNRVGLEKRLEKDLSLVTRHHENLVLMVFELDDYPAIYERIGKKVSDNIIKTVAKLLRSAVRKEDSVARDGLSRFLISLPTAKAAGVVALAKRICARVNTFKLKMGSETLTLFASVGIASTEGIDSVSGKTLLSHAMSALDEARSEGPGVVKYYQPVQQLDPSPQDCADISLDELLAQIEHGGTTVAPAKMKAVMIKLSPLFALMDDEQKKSLFTLTQTVRSQ